MHDLRFAVRMLFKNPAFTLVAVLSLAIGIGVNAAMFSLADALLLRPLSVSRPGEVVSVESKTPSKTSGDLSYRDYLDFRDRSKSFAGLVAFTTSTFGFSARPDDLPQMKMGMLVSGNLFRVMGVEPSHTIVIEDTPIGVRAGAAAGMTVIGYAELMDANKLLAAGASACIEDMGELGEILLRTA